MPCPHYMLPSVFDYFESGALVIYSHMQHVARKEPAKPRCSVGRSGRWRQNHSPICQGPSKQRSNADGRPSNQCKDIRRYTRTSLKALQGKKTRQRGIADLPSASTGSQTSRPFATLHCQETKICAEKQEVTGLSHTHTHIYRHAPLIGLEVALAFSLPICPLCQCHRQRLSCCRVTHTHNYNVMNLSNVT